jgi:hypothetical protein
MKINKKLFVSIIFLIPILAVGATLVYSASFNDAKSSLIQEVMNPFDFFKQCREIGGLVFSWDNGYGCDFADDYDVICDNMGVCGEGFVTEIDPQYAETDSHDNNVTGTIFDVGLHNDSSEEQLSSPPQEDLIPQTGNADGEEEQTSEDPGDDSKDQDDNSRNPSVNPPPEVIEAYCDSIGGTYVDEGNMQGCEDIPGGRDDIVCSNLEPCFLGGDKLTDNIENNIPTSFGALTPVDANNIYLFVNKPGGTPFSFLIKSDDSRTNPLAGSNQLYNNLADQAKDGDPINIGNFRLKSKWGAHEYEGLMFPISKLAYLLPESPEQPPDVVEQDEQAVEPEPTEQVLLTVSPKQNMNCRCGAGTYTNIYTTFSVDTVATVLSKNVDEDWYFVELEGGARCWVWGNGLQDVSHLDNVPIPDSTSMELDKVCSQDNGRDDSGTIDTGDGGGGGGGDPYQPPDYNGPDQYDPLDPSGPTGPVVN